MKGASAYSRRHFITVAAAGLALSKTLEAKMINSRIHSVYVGMQSFSLRMLRYEAVIVAMKELGIGECELFATQVEPLPADVPDIVKWRATDAALDFFKDVRKKFNDAGITIYGYNPRFGVGGGRGGRGRGPGAAGSSGSGGPGAAAGQGAAGANGSAAPPPATAAAPATPPALITDEEIDRLFVISRVLGASTINSGVQPVIAERVARYAEKHKMIVGITNLTPEVLALSPYYRYDIDTGGYTTQGLDPLRFVMENFDKITDIHLKDCKLNGPSVPFGTGDSHLKEILQLLKKRNRRFGPTSIATIPAQAPR